MNLLIVTSSYPASADDPGEAAGLFVRAFAQECAARGHRVVVQPVSRKPAYQADPGLVIEPIPWAGGGRALSQVSLADPRSWPAIARLALLGGRVTAETVRRHRIDRVMCMWVVPCGLFGRAAARRTGVEYDVWALGSDIWKIGTIPVAGKALIRHAAAGAGRVYADGLGLGRQVEAITGREAQFLPSSRVLPGAEAADEAGDGRMRLLFVGRYHRNKGPDVLLRALAGLSPAERGRLRVDMRGLGPMQDELRAMVERLGLADTVRLGGPVGAAEMAGLLDSAHYLVIPSRVESIPVVFSDAMQRSAPVITTPVGDLSELVEEFGCGIAAAEATPQALAEALRQGLDRDRSALVQGTRRAAELFSVAQAAQAWLDDSSSPGTPNRTTR
jgi:glycosyltransferase involved in cell wall biosynthesis